MMISGSATIDKKRWPVAILAHTYDGWILIPFYNLLTLNTKYILS